MYYVALAKDFIDHPDIATRFHASHATPAILATDNAMGIGTIVMVPGQNHAKASNRRASRDAAVASTTTATDSGIMS